MCKVISSKVPEKFKYIPQHLMTEQMAYSALESAYESNNKFPSFDVIDHIPQCVFTEKLSWTCIQVYEYAIQTIPKKFVTQQMVNYVFERNNYVI